MYFLLAEVFPEASVALALLAAFGAERYRAVYCELSNYNTRVCQ